MIRFGPPHLQFIVFDNNGNTTSKTDSTGATNYTWDFENRLSSVTLPGSGGTVTFKYDPFGRRIYKSSSSGTSIFAYDQDNLIEETNASGSVIARYTQMDVDEPLAMLRSGTTSYYHADALNSITSLSNTAGALANTYTYDSFGNITNSTGSIVNPFRYAARDFDAETNLHYFRTRYLDPSTGRFLSEDTARFDESVNFYPYVNNNPLTFNDPFGQGIVDCAVELAKLAALEAKLGARLAEQAAASCKDAGHQKAIDQLRNAVDKQAAKVARHCSDADTKKQLLLLGVLAVAIATAPETGGGSLGWAWGVAAAFLMKNKLHPEVQNTTEFSFLGNPRKVITRERQGQYSNAGDLELGDYATTWERTFDGQGRPLEWKFFEDSALDSVSEYRYEGEECVVTERDAHGKVVKITKQKPFSVIVQGNVQRVSLPDSWPVSGVVASLKHEFDFDSKGNWIKHTTTTTVASTKVVHVEEREITYW